MDLPREPDMISEIRRGTIQWLGNAERIPEEKTVKNVFKNISELKRSVGKPRKRWLDDVENYVKKTGVRGWRKITGNRGRLDIDSERCQDPTWTVEQGGRTMWEDLELKFHSIFQTYIRISWKNASKNVHNSKYIYCLTCPTCRCGFLGIKW